MDDSGAFLAWAAQAIARRWPRARVEEIAALRGDLSSRRFWRVAIATRGDTAALFRLATTELLRLHVDGTARIDSRCIAREIAYTGRLFEWELKEFAEVGLAAVAPGADFSPIAPELTRLAARLDRFPRVFSHRD